MIALGGFVNSSAVILWSVVSPLGALLFAEFKFAPRWLTAYLCLLILSGFLQSIASPSNNLSKEVITLFFVLNIGTGSAFFFILLSYFIGLKNHTYKLLQIEQERSDTLLLNVLPSEVALRLKNGERVIADHFANTSILFADLVGFTSLSAESSPVEMVTVLNDVYSEFDSLVEKHKLEKIRTMGDGYMVVSGVPVARHDHAQAIANLALEMVTCMKNRAPFRGRQLQFRMGINSGEVIAGIIGLKKFHYDIWGDAVNTASRMESHGEPGKIQISRETYLLLMDDFICEPKGTMEIKGKGLMETWFLVGKKN